MHITDVRITLTDHPKVKAYVSITLDECFAIKGMKIIEGQTGTFVAMPSRKGKNGDYQDLAHPINNSVRKWMEDIVLEKYEQEVDRKKRPGPGGPNTAGVRSPIPPSPGPLAAGEARQLEWDTDDPDADRQVGQG